MGLKEFVKIDNTGGSKNELVGASQPPSGRGITGRKERYFQNQRF